MKPNTFRSRRDRYEDKSLYWCERTISGTTTSLIPCLV